MNEKLKPPMGWANWLEYAIGTMHLHGTPCGWSRTVKPPEMREAAHAELAELRTAVEEPRTIWIQEANNCLDCRSWDGTCNAPCRREG